MKQHNSVWTPISLFTAILIALLAVSVIAAFLR